MSNHAVSRLAEVMDLAAWSSRCPVQDAPIFQGVSQAAIGRCGHTQMRAGQCPGRWQERERCVSGGSGGATTLALSSSTDKWRHSGG